MGEESGDPSFPGAVSGREWGASPVVKVSLAGLLAMSALREMRATSYSVSGFRFPMEYWFSSCVRSMLVRSPGTSLIPYMSSMLSISARGLDHVIRAVVSVTSFTSIWLGASKPVAGRGDRSFRDRGQRQGLGREWARSLPSAQVYI